MKETRLQPVLPCYRCHPPRGQLISSDTVTSDAISGLRTGAHTYRERVSSESKRPNRCASSIQRSEAGTGNSERNRGLETQKMSM